MAFKSLDIKTTRMEILKIWEANEMSIMITSAYCLESFQVMVQGGETQWILASSLEDIAGSLGKQCG